MGGLYILWGLWVSKTAIFPDLPARKVNQGKPPSGLRTLYLILLAQTVVAIKSGAFLHFPGYSRLYTLDC